MEIRRVLRNRRTMVFILIMPAVFFLLFGLPQKGQNLDNGAPGRRVRHDQPGRVRRDGGDDQRRRHGRRGAGPGLEPTAPAHPATPTAYVLTKVLTAMTLGLVAVLVEFAVGAFSGVRMPMHVWLYAGLAAWLGSLVFAAFGLFVGYLAPAENVMQFLGPILAILAMFGGLFVPLEVLPHVMQTIAKFTPVYGVGELARSPLIGTGFTMTAVVNIVLWTAAFGVGAALLYRRDTARV